MAEICHLENRNDVIFFCRGWSDLENISQTVAEWHVGCGDMVKLETRCRIPIWRMFARIQWHVIAEPRIALHHVLPPLHGAATCWIHCHDSTATCHIAAFLQGVRIPSAILKIIFRRIFSPFLMQFGLWRAPAIVSSRIHLCDAGYLRNGTIHSYTIEY